MKGKTIQMMELNIFNSKLTSTNAGYAGSVQAIRVSEGKLCPFSEMAVTYTIYWVLGLSPSIVCDVTLVITA
jgi:hypothetical protein